MISRRALFSQIALLAAGGGAAWWLREHLVWPQPVARFAPGGDSGWLPFQEPEKGVITIAVQVNGEPVAALIDSGAQSSVIDRALARKLGVPTAALSPVVMAFGVSGGPQIGRAANLTVQAGAMRLDGLRAVLLDLASISSASDRRFDLILGQDALRAAAADIDFPEGRIAFHDHTSYTPPPGARSAGAGRRGRELFAPVTVEGRPLEVALDTGATAVLALSSATAAAAGLLDGRAVGHAPAIGFGGLTQDRVVRVEQIEFAGQHWRNLPIHIYEPAKGAPLPAGLLGIEALRRFRVGIDLAAGRLDLSRGTVPFIPLVRTS